MTLRLSVIFGADYSIFLESYVKKLLKQFLKNIPWSVFPICHILVPINCNLFDSLSFSFLGVCVCVCMCMCCCLVAESFSTLCDPMDCSPPGSSVHGILQTRILERVAISFSRDSSDPGMEPLSPALAGRCFATEAPGKPVYVFTCVLFFLLLITFLLFLFSAALLYQALSYFSGCNLSIFAHQNIS